MPRFDRKVVLVTGATSGIGRATALAFARERAKVVTTGRRQQEGEETIRLVRAEGGEATFIRADVGNEDEVRRLIDQTVSIYGRLDCAFNNAGTIALSPIADATENDYRSVVDTNVKGVLLCTKYQIRQMRRLGGGAIVNASSLAGLRGSRDRSFMPPASMRSSG
jgi:NAD(P)-dependent dehydrogenase (short-subunit alcohol dehydrogenase family)